MLLLWFNVFSENVLQGGDVPPTSENFFFFAFKVDDASTLMNNKKELLVPREV
jgi:hypothetical protein